MVAWAEMTNMGRLHSLGGSADPATILTDNGNRKINLDGEWLLIS